MRHASAIALFIALLSVAASLDAADKTSDPAAKARKLEDWKQCTEFGRLMRSKDKEKQRPYYEALLNEVHRFGVVAADYTPIANRGLRVGMTACAVLASLGRPTRRNRTVSGRGNSDQLVYETPRRLYVYLTDDVVTGWQE